MKYCGQCGASMEDNMIFCTKCGFNNGAPETPATPETPYQRPQPINNPYQNNAAKPQISSSGNQTVLIAVGAGIAALVIAWYISAYLGLIIAIVDVVVSFKSDKVIAKVASAISVAIVAIWIVTYMW